MKKNILLLGLAFIAGLETTQAQQRVLPVRYSTMKPVPFSTPTPENLNNVVNVPGVSASQPVKNHKIGAASYGTEIGRTYYDLPSNSSTANRLLRHSDGTISAVWTEHCSAGAPNYVNRGIGYNYFNGTTWIEGNDGTCPDQFGIATRREGWPEIFELPNDREAVISHSGTGLSFSSRPTKGTGGLAAWSPTVDIPHTVNIGGVSGNVGTWPRVATNGNTIHMIYTINNTPLPKINGIDGIMAYSRSTDGGVTWDKQNVFLPSENEAFFDFISADNYAISVKGNTVAIVAGHFGSTWTLWKSVDNGNTFSRRIIDNIIDADLIVRPNATPVDTVAFGNDGNHTVIIDNNNVVHVFAGQILLSISDENRPASNRNYKAPGWFPGVGDSLLYWNDAMPLCARPQAIAGVEDRHPVGDPLDWVAFDTNKRIPYGTTGDVSQPNAAIDAAGNIYVAYAAVVEGTSNTTTDTGQPFRDLYLMKRTAVTGIWSKPLNIPVALNVYGDGTNAAENFEESVSPTLAHEIGADNKLHMQWFSDSEPGTSARTGTTADLDLEALNSIMYTAINLSSLTFVNQTPQPFAVTDCDILLLGVDNEATAFVNNISAFPNPTASKALVQIDLKKSAKVSVKLANIMGQEVAATVTKNIVAGSKDSVVELDLSALAKGVYTYTVSTNDFTVTKRIVKQ